MGSNGFPAFVNFAGGKWLGCGGGSGVSVGLPRRSGTSE